MRGTIARPTRSNRGIDRHMRSAPAHSFARRSRRRSCHRHHTPADSRRAYICSRRSPRRHGQLRSRRHLSRNSSHLLVQSRCHLRACRDHRPPRHGNLRCSRRPGAARTAERVSRLAVVPSEPHCHVDRSITRMRWVRENYMPSTQSPHSQNESGGVPWGRQVVGETHSSFELHGSRH